MKMAKAETKAKTKTPEQVEEERRLECMEKVNEVLKEYNYAMVPYNQPTWKFVKVDTQDNEQETTEQNRPA